jgi:hypothetical protein
MVGHHVLIKLADVHLSLRLPRADGHFALARKLRTDCSLSGASSSGNYGMHLCLSGPSNLQASSLASSFCARPRLRYLLRARGVLLTGHTGLGRLFFAPSMKSSPLPRPRFHLDDISQADGRQERHSCTVMRLATGPAALGLSPLYEYLSGSLRWKPLADRLEGKSASLRACLIAACNAKSIYLLRSIDEIDRLLVARSSVVVDSAGAHIQTLSSRCSVSSVVKMMAANDGAACGKPHYRRAYVSQMGAYTGKLLSVRLRSAAQHSCATMAQWRIWWSQGTDTDTRNFHGPKRVRCSVCCTGLLLPGLRLVSALALPFALALHN